MTLIEPFLTANGLAALLTLTVLEVVLGIDNLVFISILTGRLDKARAKTARAIGLGLAFLFRIMLLGSLSWIMNLRHPILKISDFDLSWRDLILIGGGLFLMVKATHEIHNEVEAREEVTKAGATRRNLLTIIGQLAVIDLVFSIDSIVTAVGLADDLEVMIVAVCLAMIVMYFAAGPVGEFIQAYPTTKMLALAFLLLIGVALIADGFAFHIPRGYIYFAMTFAGMVEVFNVLARRNRRKKRR